VTNETLHLYRNDVTEWFSAATLEEAVSHARTYLSEICGIADERDMDLDLRQEPDDKLLTLTDECDANDKTTKTAAEWARETGPGFFMTTEY